MAASSAQKSAKLYCYVDETGQDTQGQFFVVVAVVLGQDRDNIRRLLEHIEAHTGKGKVKWTKSRKPSREAYLAALPSPHLQNSVFYRIYAGGRAYEDLTVLAIAQAVHRYADLHKLDTYQATIIIDGLKGKEVQRVGRDLRHLGVKTRKVRGLHDESEPLIRLADAMAGVIRQAYLGMSDAQTLQGKLQRERVLYEL